MAAMIQPIQGGEHGEEQHQLDDLLSFLGYRPNALFTMARKPGLLAAVLQLVHVTLRGPGLLEPELRFLVACEASRLSGCVYSTAHMLHAANHQGISWQKLAALDSYLSSDAFTPAEQAALTLASAGATLPVVKTEAMFTQASAFYNQDELVEIVAAIAAFGVFNRWNSLVGSELEAEPASAFLHIPWLVEMKSNYAN
ncbi:carboxymuconolactone decarboxylase family protein [Alcaligenaceae bacterium]|nr:carboxymuconolactone decarboxylase family protein [Alcaligenaceae bacterium]